MIEDPGAAATSSAATSSAATSSAATSAPLPANDPGISASPTAAAPPRHDVTIPYRVRFDECGPDAIVRTSALLRYAQDVAWVHSERMGFGREWYAERGLAWVVRAAELAILVAIPLGTTLAVSTGVTGFRRVWARRRTEARRRLRSRCRSRCRP